MLAWLENDEARLYLEILDRKGDLVPVAWRWGWGEEGVTVDLRASMKEDGWRSQTAGRNIRPLRARRECPAGQVSPVVHTLFHPFVSSCCSADSQPSTGCTAGPPRYLKSAWTSESAGSAWVFSALIKAQLKDLIIFNTLMFRLNVISLRHR